jgi:hypothetical protein
MATMWTVSLHVDDMSPSVLECVRVGASETECDRVDLERSSEIYRSE